MFRPSSVVALLLLSATGAALAAAGEGESDAYADDAVAADAGAASELRERVSAILGGQEKDTFHTGDVLRSEVMSEVELQGACFMDKVDAMINEGVVWEEPKGLQADIASCCAKGNKLSCVKEVAPIYELVGKIAEDGTDVANRAAHAAALLVNAASKRIPRDKISSRMLRFFGLCEAKPHECTFDKLAEFEVSTEADTSLAQFGAARKHRHRSDDDTTGDDEDVAGANSKETDESVTGALEDLKKLVGKIEDKVQNKNNAHEVDEVDEGLSSKGAEASEEKTASATLEGMLGQIESGDLPILHFMGDMLNQDDFSFDESEKVGGCLLDKVNAIVMDDAYLEDIQTLQNSVASCCAGEQLSANSSETKAACVKDVGPAYKLLAEVANSDRGETMTVGGKEWEENMNRAAQAVALLIKAAEGRLKVKKLSDKGLFFVGRCSEAPEKCTMEELFAPVSVSQFKGKAKATKKQKARAVKKEKGASLLEVETTTLVLR